MTTTGESKNPIASRLAQHERAVHGLMHWLDAQLHEQTTDSDNPSPDPDDVRAILRPNPTQSQPTANPHETAVQQQNAAHAALLSRIAAHERDVFSHCNQANNARQPGGA